MCLPYFDQEEGNYHLKTFALIFFRLKNILPKNMKKETVLKFGRKKWQKKEDRTDVTLSGLNLKQIKKAAQVNSIYTPYKHSFIFLVNKYVSINV